MPTPASLRESRARQHISCDTLPSTMSDSSIALIYFYSKQRAFIPVANYVRDHAWQEQTIGLAPSNLCPINLHFGAQVREARLAAQVAAEAVDRDELLALNLQHPPDRELVVYDDI